MNKILTTDELDDCRPCKSINNINDHTEYDWKANKENQSIPVATSRACISCENESQQVSKGSEVVSSEVYEYVSIYNIYTTSKRNLILASVSIVAFLLTFSDTVYLPSLNTVLHDLKTTELLVIMSVSIYLFASGLSGLFWGPISDRFGRKITMMIALSIFVVASIVCIFATNIILFIVFRAVEGAAISATVVVGKAVVADIYPVKTRGWGTGIFYLPLLVGPIIGPVIGGVISDAFGWHSTFILVSICSFVILIMVILFVPETHQYFVREHFHRTNPNKRIIDLASEERPNFQKPWKSLTFLADITMAPYVAVATLIFTAMFISLTVLPGHLGNSPYNYREKTIGILYVPCGVATLLGSVLGGLLSDKARIYYGDIKCPEGCLVPALVFSILSPIGLVIYGWAFFYRLHVAVPIIGQILLGFSYSVLSPGVSAYLTAKKQEQAAAVSSINNFLDCCISSIFVTVAIPFEKAMGTGYLFTLICGINLVAIILVSFLVYKGIHRTKT